MNPGLTPRLKDYHEFIYGLLTSIAKIEPRGHQSLQRYSLTHIMIIYTVGGSSINNIWTIIRQRLLNVSYSQPQYIEAAYGTEILARDQLKHNALMS